MSDPLFGAVDLDLYELERAKDPDVISKMISQLYDNDNYYKQKICNQWYENILFFSGNQYNYVPIRSAAVSGSSAAVFRMKYQPRRIINKVFKATQAIASSMTRHRPSIKIYPDSDDAKSEAKAKLSNLLIDYLWDEDMEEEFYYEAVLWSLLTSTVLRKDFFDFSFNPEGLIPRVNWREATSTVYDCPNCNTPSPNPQCDICRQPLSEMFARQKTEIVPDIQKDEEGNILHDQMPWHKSSIVNIFRAILPQTAGSERDMDFVGEVSIQRYDWLLQNFNRKAPGYTGEVLNITPGKASKITTVLALEQSLKWMTAGRPVGVFGNLRYDTIMKDGVVMIEIYVKPSPRFPKGRMIVWADDKILYDGDSPYQKFHPYKLYRYELFPGRIQGISYVDNLIDIQRSYNEARNEWQLVRRTMAYPAWLIPLECNVPRGTITGQPNIVIPYRGSSGQTPSRIQGASPSPIMTQDVSQCAQEFMEISGTQEVLLGRRPQGVTTYRGLDLLLEQATSVMAPSISRFEQSLVAGGQQNKLWVLRECLKYPRADLTKALKVFHKMNPRITDIEIKDFIGDDLGGRIVVEPYSSIPKLKMAQNELIMQMAQMGVLGDIVNDPALNREFKQKMGLIGFDKETDKAVKFANVVVEQLLNGVYTPPMKYQNHPIFVKVLMDELNDPQSLNWPPNVRQLFERRIEETIAQLAQENPPISGGMPPPGAPPGGPGPMPNSPTHPANINKFVGQKPNQEHIASEPVGKPPM